MAQDLMSIPITTVASDQVLALGKKFLLRIDHVFYLRMWKLRCVLKVSYMDLKVTSFFYSHNYTILILY